MTIASIEHFLVYVLGLGLVWWAVGQFLPGLIVRKFHLGYEAIKNSDWVRDRSKPYRAKWLLATAQMLEQEIPDPGAGKELYAKLGDWIAARSPALAGTGPKWADVLENVGNGLDTDLAGDIKEIADLDTPQ